MPCPKGSTKTEGTGCGYQEHNLNNQALMSANISKFYHPKKNELVLKIQFEDDTGLICDMAAWVLAKLVDEYDNCELNIEDKT